MKHFVASDLHFSHKNILKFNAATRQYRDIDHMNEELISGWNKDVTNEDLVYFLGDFAFTNGNKAFDIISRLNGRKIMIEGNHDKRLLEHAGFRNSFESIHSYLEIDYSGTKIILSHYPHAEWNACHRGSLMLHGHLHGSPTGMEKYRIMDVGLDSTGKIVSDLDDVVRELLTHEIKTHGYVKSVIDSRGHFVEVK